LKKNKTEFLFSVSKVPIVTLYEEFDDLRADEETNHIFTCVFSKWTHVPGKVEISEVQHL